MNDVLGRHSLHACGLPRWRAGLHAASVVPVAGAVNASKRNVAVRHLRAPARRCTLGRVERVGVLVVGGGIVGTGIAWSLAVRGVEGIVVVDLDLAGLYASSELNAGGARATWWQPVNIETCRATLDFFRAHADDVGFREHGYLWLYTDGSLGARRGEARAPEYLRARGRDPHTGGRLGAVSAPRPGARRDRGRDVLAPRRARQPECRTDALP